MFFLFPSFTEYKIQNLCAPDHTWSSLYNKTPFSPSNWKFCSFWNVILSVVLYLYLCIYYFSISFSHFQPNFIYLLSVYLMDKTDKQYCFKSYIWYKLNLDHKTHLAYSFHSSDLYSAKKPKKGKDPIWVLLFNNILIYMKLCSFHPFSKSRLSSVWHLKISNLSFISTWPWVFDRSLSKLHPQLYTRWFQYPSYTVTLNTMHYVVKTLLCPLFV